MKRFSIHFIVCLFVVSQLSFCISDDRLTYGEFISLNKTLISDGGNFALGFFSPTNASTDLYIGIWYHNLPQRTVVWVANRDSPIKDSSATFGITNDTNIAIADSKGRQVWSSNIKNTAAVGNNGGTSLVLLNTGNLVFRHGIETTLWQSFDHFTDTFLPGMKLGVSPNGILQRLTSWKNETDPSSGNFSSGIDPNSYLQIFTWQGLEPYARTPVWTGSFYFGDLVQNSSSVVYISFIFDGNKIYITLSVSDSSSKIKARLDHLGQTKLLIWDASIESWRAQWSQPLHQCDKYGWCGPFGNCDNTATMPSCKCLEGFEPTVLSEWISGNFSSGCTRKKELQCGSRDIFLRLSNMQAPDKFVFLRNRNISECAAECIANCSCTAYAYADLSTTNIKISRCLIWIEPLLDTQTLTRGEDLYLRLAASELGLSGSINKKRITLLVLLLSVAIVSAICIYLLWKFRGEIKGLSRNQKRRNPLVNYSASSIGLHLDFSGSNDLGNGISEQGPELPLFNFKTIVAATDNFANSNMLGKGGFGKVYKGKLPDGQNIAVKRLTQGSGQGLHEFKTEIILIAKLQHKNLVRLLGCCIEGEEKLLIYEYLPNKSLDVFLFDPNQKAILDWTKRFSIIKGIARALLYLHQDSRLKVIHRDLKASNILLDKEMNPKVSDFGMARIFSYNQNQANTNRVVGTFGYMAPEYVMKGQFSVKSDVYSFGVLLLEIVSGFRNNTIPFIMDFPNLLAYVWKFWSEGRAEDIADPSMTAQFSKDELIRCINIGLLCVQDCPDDRPIMSSVVFMLENETKTFPMMKQPFFTLQRNFELEANADSDIHSSNNVTVTTIQGR